jgi:phospholipid-transporting ATPase
LIVAQKEVDGQFYDKWNKKFQKALTSMNNRLEQIDKLAE